MKPEIHPEYVPVTINCACGTTFETKSTIKEMSVDICSQCHPFFTGKSRIVDREGRVERFKNKYKKKAK